MIETDDTQYSLSQPDIADQSLAIRGARLPEEGQFDGRWLDEARSVTQKPYVRADGRVINQDPYRYFTIPGAEQGLSKATNELHLMYLHATDESF